MGKGRGGAGRGFAGRGTKPSTRGGKPKKTQDASGIPKRTGELGACKELEGHIFILSVGSKAKDGDIETITRWLT